MKYFLIRLFLISLWLFPSLVFADIAILIHGYNTNSHTWRNSGITSILATKGWHDISYSGQTLNQSGKYLISVQLPAKSPIDVQANYLSQYLSQIVNNNPGHKIHLIAHSAGGIVARLTLVKNYSAFIYETKLNDKERSNKKPNDKKFQFFPIVQLITIATPHLGSPIAEMAHTASDTPIGFFAPFFGMDEINDAEILYQQLSREHKSHFLYWLNRQAHPPIKFISIVRADGSLLKGDIFVPPRSQNMSEIKVLSKDSYFILTPGDHGLKYSDGIIISNLLP